jgi:hypothetical protein
VYPAICLADVHVRKANGIVTQKFFPQEKMQIEGAIIKEQGLTFGIIIVKPHAMSNSSVASETRANFQGLLREFSSIPLVLASQDSRGRFSYQGRSDIVDFLTSIVASRIPWKRYSYAI